MKSRSVRHSQQGMVLVVSLIMLLAVTLMIVTASNLVQTNLKIVNNMESREQARFAAIAAIEEAISSGRFTEPGTTIFVVSRGTDRQRRYDSNGDTVNDVKVQLSKPECISVIPTKNSELDVFNSPSEASCYLKDAVYSMCAASVWELEAVATDVVSGAEVTVRQGVSVLTTLNKIDSACPEPVSV
jgi:hypothetical protein